VTRRGASRRRAATARRRPGLSRRSVLAGAAAGLAAGPLALGAGAAGAQSAAAAEAIRTFVGGGPLVEGGIVLDVPMLAETGNAVPLAVSVPAPDAGPERIVALAIVLDRNPEPVAALVRFGPAAGERRVATRLRFFARQNVIALAKQADGRCRVARRPVEITLAACVDEEQI
jgi:sulfur-oxidizing protein SoxY